MGLFFSIFTRHTNGTQPKPSELLLCEAVKVLFCRDVWGNSNKLLSKFEEVSPSSHAYSALLGSTEELQQQCFVSVYQHAGSQLIIIPVNLRERPHGSLAWVVLVVRVSTSSACPPMFDGWFKGMVLEIMWSCQSRRQHSSRLVFRRQPCFV